MTDEVEASPDKFMRLKYGPALVGCRERVASLIGADVDECVLVPNAIHGINTVLRNISWNRGDVIIKGRCPYLVFAWSNRDCFSDDHLRRRRQSSTLCRGYKPTAYIGNGCHQCTVHIERDVQSFRAMRQECSVFP